MRRASSPRNNSRAQNTQDLQQRTLQIELLAERMIAADSRAVARQAYTRILSELDALGPLTARLAVSEDVSVLDLHPSSQSFRNSAHVLARLRDAAPRPGPDEAPPSTALRGDRDEMQVHAQALARSARAQSDRLARAHQAAVLRVVDASQASAYWGGAWLAFNLVAAWLIARVFLGQHAISRLQRVSRNLLCVDDEPGGSPPMCPCMAMRKSARWRAAAMDRPFRWWCRSTRWLRAPATGWCLQSARPPCAGKLSGI